MGAVYEARHLGTGRRVAVKVIVERGAREEPGGRRAASSARRWRAARSSRSTSRTFSTPGIDPATGQPVHGDGAARRRGRRAGAIKRSAPSRRSSRSASTRRRASGCRRRTRRASFTATSSRRTSILARRDGGEIVAKILDFGIAKMKMRGARRDEGKALTRTGTMLGSPLYMSPEQALGKKDDRPPDRHLVARRRPLRGASGEGAARARRDHRRAHRQHLPQPAPHVQDVAPWVPPRGRGDRAPGARARSRGALRDGRGHVRGDRGAPAERARARRVDVRRAPRRGAAGRGAAAGARRRPVSSCSPIARPSRFPLGGDELRAHSARNDRGIRTSVEERGGGPAQVARRMGRARGRRCPPRRNDRRCDWSRELSLEHARSNHHGSRGRTGNCDCYRDDDAGHIAESDRDSSSSDAARRPRTARAELEQRRATGERNSSPLQVGARSRRAPGGLRRGKRASRRLPTLTPAPP